MASINDVNKSVNKVNTTLHKEINSTDTVNTSVGQVNTSVGNVKTSVDNVAGRVDNLDKDVNSGFAQTIFELKNLEAIEGAAVQLLFHLTQQTDTMICILKQISQNTCGILNQVTIQTDLQKHLLKDSHIIRSIEVAEHPGAALAHHELEELREQIEKCCPPQVPPPPCTYQACPSPNPIDRPNLPKPGTTPNNPSTGLK